VGSPAFANAQTALQRVWSTVANEPEFELKRSTWARYLAVTYGSLTGQKRADLDRLFLTHTYLALIARFLVWAALRPRRRAIDVQQTVGAILSGDFFRSKKLQNLVEDDFFSWIASPIVADTLLPVWQRVLGQLLYYDFAQIAEQDVLKGLYQELIDPKDRHDLGEYYTPDWLCEALVREMVSPDSMERVLDPTCGSGSFLRAAISHIRSSSRKVTGAEQLHAILQRVTGIDIHPLAVTISKATYALALGPLLSAARRPVRIPVYLADSLFLPLEVEQYELGKGRSVQVRISEKKIRIPLELIQAPEAFDAAISACQSVAIDHARSKRESKTSLVAFLKREAPTVQDLSKPRDAEEALWQFTEALAELIRKRRDSIWAFIVRNAYRPAMLKGQFDIILGNPPWLAYRYIEDPEYQQEVKRRALVEYQIAPAKQKLFSHMELATLFLVHSLHTFGRDQAKLAFVMPHSVWSADQHSPLREAAYRATVTITNLWDLRDVSPLFNVPAGVLFAVRENATRDKHSRIPMTSWLGRLPDANASYAEAMSILEQEESVARRIYLGRRSAWSDEKGAGKPSPGSPYAPLFRQGATIVPRNCFFVAGDIEWPAEPDALYHLVTEEKQAALSKPPYRDIRMTGEIEGAFLYRAALSRHVLPFVVLELDTVVLPLLPVEGNRVLTQEGTRSRVLSPEELRREGYRRAAQWMQTVAGHWAEGRGRKDEMSIEARLDYQGLLRCQPSSSRFLVLYNAAGSHVSCAVFDASTIRGQLIVEHKLYWFGCDREEEANYLAAVLNSDVVNESIKPFQSLGLLGERDIEKKLLELPIPSYRAGNALQERLAELGKSAAKRATAVTQQLIDEPNLGASRNAAREAVGDILDEIDRLTEKLLRAAFSQQTKSATSPEGENLSLL
jgi:hypothetical protein